MDIKSRYTNKKETKPKISGGEAAEQIDENLNKKQKKMKKKDSAIVEILEKKEIDSTSNNIEMSEKVEPVPIPVINQVLDAKKNIQAKNLTSSEKKEKPKVRISNFLIYFYIMEFLFTH
jgi:hypothetical protein